MILDSSALLAALDADDAHHAAAGGALARAQPPLLLSPFVLAELDYFLNRRVGQAAELRLLGQVADGVYRLQPFDAADVAAAQAVIERYADLRIGLTDASLVVLAERHQTRDLLTLDERHFRAIEGPGGRPFRLLPADA